MSNRQERKAQRLVSQTSKNIPTSNKKDKVYKLRLVSGFSLWHKILISFIICVIGFVICSYIYKHYFGPQVRFRLGPILIHHNVSSPLDEFSMILIGVLRQSKIDELKILSAEVSLESNSGEKIGCEIENLKYDTLNIFTGNGDTLNLKNLKRQNILQQTIYDTKEDTCNLYLKIHKNMNEFRNESDYKLKLWLTDANGFIHNSILIIDMSDSSLINFRNHIK